MLPKNGGPLQTIRLLWSFAGYNTGSSGPMPIIIGSRTLINSTTYGNLDCRGTHIAIITPSANCCFWARSNRPVPSLNLALCLFFFGLISLLSRTWGGIRKLNSRNKPVDAGKVVESIFPRKSPTPLRQNTFPILELADPMILFIFR